MKQIDTAASNEPLLVEESAFLSDIDRYVEAAERGQEFRLFRDGIAICRLGPANV